MCRRCRWRRNRRRQSSPDHRRWKCRRRRCRHRMRRAFRRRRGPGRTRHQHRWHRSRRRRSRRHHTGLRCRRRRRLYRRSPACRRRRCPQCHCTCSRYSCRLHRSMIHRFWSRSAWADSHRLNCPGAKDSTNQSRQCRRRSPSRRPRWRGCRGLHTRRRPARRRPGSRCRRRQSHLRPCCSQ